MVAGGILPQALDGAGRRTVGEDEIVALLRLCGWALDPTASTAGPRAALDALVAAELPHDRRRFDPAEVINFVKLRRAGAGGFWRDRYVATGRALIAESCGVGGATRPDLAALRPRRFDLLIRRRFGLGAVPAGVRLRLRLPLPIAGARLGALSVTPIVPADAECRIAPGRLEVRLPRPAQAEVAIAARLSFVADPAARDDGPVEPEWLAPDEALAIPPVLAAPLPRDPFAAMLALYDRLIDSFAYGVIPYDRLGGGDAQARTIGAGWYDCRLGARLLVALARAHGLPARLVGGHLLWRAPTEHYWAEVRVPDRGWLPFDLGGWDLSDAGADRGWRHLLAGVSDYRMPTQILPRLFTGPPGVPFPPAWHRLMRAIPGGTETRFVAIPDGRLLFAEEVLHLEPEGETVRSLDRDPA